MIIKTLDVTAFRGLPDGEYEVDDGLTVIRGPNEAGKSTFQLAIITALFGDPTSSAREWERLHRWNAGRDLRVELTFKQDGNRYRLLRDFEDGISELEDLQTGKLTEGRDAVNAKLAKVASITTRDLYQATACLRQQDLAELRAGGQLRDMLSQSMTGGADESRASEVLDEIDSEISGTFRKGVRGGDPGEYQARKRQLEGLQERQAEIRQEAEKTHEARQFVAEHQHDFEQMQQELQNKQTLFDRVSDRQKKQNELDDLQEKCDNLADRIAKLETLQRKINTLEEDLADLPEVAEDSLEKLRDMRSAINTNRDNLQGAESEQEKHAESREQAEAELQETAEARRRYDQAQRNATYGYIAAGGAAIATVILAITGTSGWWIGLIIAVIAGAYGLLQRPSGDPPDVEAAEGRLREIDAEIEALRTTIRNSTDAIERITRQREEFLDDLGFESADELEKVVQKRKKLADDLRDARSRLQVMMGDDSLDELRRDLASQQASRDTLKETLESAAWLDAKMEPEQIRKLREEINRLEDEVKELGQKLSAHQYALEQSRYDIEDLHDIEARVADQQERLNRLQERWDVLELVREVLQEAQQAAMTSAMDRLGPEINTHLEELTEGRYNQVEMNEALEPSVYSDEKADYIKVDNHYDRAELSLATREQVYLACRLAFTRLLWEDEAPPVMLDDPLVNFDADRKERALGIIRQMAESRQVLLFTCSDEYDGAADRVIELPEV